METSHGHDAEVERLEKELARVLERERDLTDFIENASLGLHWVDADGKIIWANQAELDLLGYSREEYIGHQIAEFHVDADVIEDILRRLRNKETLRNYEARVRCKSGRIRDVQITSNVRWDDQRFVHTRCFTRDVTERKRYEERLLVQNGVGRILSNASSMSDAATPLLGLVGEDLGLCVGLLWTCAPDGSILNYAACWETAKCAGFAAHCEKLTFTSGVGLPGRIMKNKAPGWIADLRADDNFPRFALALKYGLHSAFGFPILSGEKALGVVEFFADEIRPLDNELLQMGGSLGYQIGAFVERTESQQRVADREEGYRALAETASDGIITFDSSSTILFVNAAVARMFGYTCEELLGRDLTILMPESMRAAYKKMLAGYLETGKHHLPSLQSIPLSGEHRHGHKIPLEVSIGEYKQRDRHVFVGVIRDITERKRLEETLRQTTKLESLGVLAGGIAHDFNNLLTGILGNISLCSELLPESHPAKSNLNDAVEASERAAHLTKQLLAYAGRGRFLVEPIDLSVLVKEISALVKSSIPKHVTLRLDLQQPLPLVEADVAQLQQLIMNLVINGAEAIPQGRQGTVLVVTRSQMIDSGDSVEPITTDSLVPGRYIGISVHDNGTGMDTATMEKIFDPFFTTKFTGRGLGLAAVQGIVRGHKGTLKIFSSPGEGTTFRVLLPAMAADTPKALVSKVACDLGGNGTVLVVDDESIVRKIATSVLERYGYAVVTAEDGREGVTRFRELHARLTVVLLDMTMPVLGGEEAFQEMRSIDPEVPVVLSSGYNEADAIRRFAGTGLAGVIQKPYTASALAEKLRNVIKQTARVAF
jgi:PAS domain S-box-containing protein